MGVGFICAFLHSGEFLCISLWWTCVVAQKTLGYNVIRCSALLLNHHVYLFSFNVTLADSQVDTVYTVCWVQEVRLSYALTDNRLRRACFTCLCQWHTFV